MTDISPEPLDPAAVRANRATWIAALRSGDYRQGQGRLRTSTNGYCCLGVAEDVRGATWGHLNRSYEVVDESTDLTVPVVVDAGHTLGYETSVLTTAGARWLGLTEIDPFVAFYDDASYRSEPFRLASLAELNDTVRLSLAEIAEVVADQPVNWTGDVVTVQADVERRNSPTEEES